MRDNDAPTRSELKNRSQIAPIDYEVPDSPPQSLFAAHVYQHFKQ